jgi:aryl-alcohol dehydrogenase-like predicted oxidoreductase
VRLKEEGKVRWIGVSNFTVGQMKRAPTIAPITSLQPPYAVVRCEIEQKISPFCLSQNSRVIVYSPMFADLLTGAMTRERVANFLAGDWRRNLPGFREPALLAICG